MLFNSFIFLLVFLPLVLIAFYGARRFVSARASLAVLVLSSFIFYAYWEPVYLLLLLASIGLNYWLGQRLAAANPPRSLLVAGVAINLGLLGYFKYTNFLIDSANSFFGLSVEATQIVLPLAISFFTFQQIAYLVDCYRNITGEKDFLSYCLFVSFFPQLIAGPIVHHKEMMPQFAAMADKPQLRPAYAAGLSLFIIGLAKKVLLADNFAVYVNSYYGSAAEGLLFVGDAWSGALAYHLQIYFDFSGYSDMAIGIGLLFGVRLPINFDSPTKSRSIIEFWRRWHMTLSRFLRDYLYIGLGGNRRGPVRRYLNLVITMTLGGLWHGAAWTFVFWGILHGTYLLVNHAWRALCERSGLTALYDNTAYRCASLAVTLFAVVIAWVYFRAPDMVVANQTVLAMFGQAEGGMSPAFSATVDSGGFGALAGLLGLQVSAQVTMVLALAAGFAITLLLPNSMQLINLIENRTAIRWRPNMRWAAFSAVLLACSLVGMFGASEFIYFQF
ncbi:MAG: MBOAT family protein [Halioglobus sp.]|nr:MBOAT family protein [Halioglobus sp.]